MRGVRFLDRGSRTGAARRRAEAWWEARCADLQVPVKVVVMPTDVFNLFDDEWIAQYKEEYARARMTIPPQYQCRSAGRALNRKAKVILIPTETLRQWYWQATLEHELLHILHPQWSEELVEQVAWERREEMPMGFRQY